MKSNKVLQVILWVLATCLTVSFIMFLSAGIQEMYWFFYSDSYHDDDYCEYLLEEDDYIHLIYSMKKQVEPEDVTPEYTEFYALAEYYKAASLHKAYIVAEDFESAMMQLEIMEKNSEKIVKYEAYIDRIHELLQMDITYPNL